MIEKLVLFSLALATIAIVGQPSSQNQAFNGLLFLFRHVLQKEFERIEGVVRAKREPSIPHARSKPQRGMQHLNGVYTQRDNRAESTHGPLFRGRTTDVLIEGACGRSIDSWTASY